MNEYEKLNGPLVVGGDFAEPLKQRPSTLSDHHGFGTPVQYPAWFEIRVFYLRVSSCPSTEYPEELVMRYPPRSITTALEISGARIVPSEEATLTLRRDRVDRDFSEVTYVSTESVRMSGTNCFGVFHKDESLLCGTLGRLDSSTVDTLDANGTYNSSAPVELGWNMDCSCAIGSRGCVFLKGRRELLTDLSPSSMEVCVVGRYSGSPVILTQTVELTARRRNLHRGKLDVIPEGDESEKPRSYSNLFGFDRPQQTLSTAMYKDFLDQSESGLEKFYAYSRGDGEDGEMSWFNAGLRVGVGVGLGMCVGVGLGVGLMVRTYQATTKSYRKGIF